jgi:hypothetical protein
MDDYLNDFEQEEFEGGEEEDLGALHFEAEVARVNAAVAELNARYGMRITPDDPEHSTVSWRAKHGETFLASYIEALKRKAARLGRKVPDLRQEVPQRQEAPAPKRMPAQRRAALSEVNDARELIKMGIRELTGGRK